MSRVRDAYRELWRTGTALGVVPAIRRAIVAARTGPSGWRYTTRLDGLEATFRTETWYEYKRATRLHGERRVISRLLDDVSGDEVCWDVGANVGVYACFVARKLTSGLVVGIEPEPRNRSRLEDNLRANAPAERWRTSPVALSDVDGPAFLDFGHPDVRRGEYGAGHYHLTPEPGPLPVDCVRGATLVERGVPAPDLLKIDVQGAELNVLRGLGSALDGVEVAYVELHPEQARRYGATAEACERFLLEAGFGLEALGEPAGNRPGAYHVRASR